MMNIPLRCGVLTGVLLLASPCWANINGKVVHKDRPLEGCVVSLGSSGHTTASDGGFSLSLPAVLPETLGIRCKGFAPKFVELQADDLELGEINLKRPNFILIVSDDHGWVQTSTQMDPDDPETRSDYFRTPNIDKFFESGIKFTRGYSPGTYCMPTRRAIQTSQSTLRHAFNGQAVRKWTDTYRNLVTIPKALKDADPDYMTAHLGKWDLRYDDPHPRTLGYDISDGATGNGEGNVGSRKSKKGKMDKSALNPAADPKMIHDLTTRGIGFIQQQVEADKPFFLQLSHYALHLAVFFKPETYDEVLGWKKGKKHFIPSFAAMLKDLDDGIGLFMQELEDLGIRDNTYIIFMADNGGRPTQNLEDGKARENLNYPLSEGKHSVYEGGIRVPFAIIGPGLKANSVITTAISGVDILPTIADIVGSELELADTDGGSIKDLIYRESETVTRPQPFLVFHDKDGRPKSKSKRADSETALLQGNFKLIKTWKDGKQYSAELYDLLKDKGEHEDLASLMPEETARLGKLLDDYIADVKGDVTIVDD
ncbi:MAG: sulfatase-like hydrolase/transferase [Gammaproteobacteria bacterium]|nr:sulfatase-like hydrolase/transferase [Gammaproteobacteria bacterium]